MNPSDLPQAWRERAKGFRKHGISEAADTLEVCAAELEEEWWLWQTEPLSLQEAADTSGFSYSAIQKMVANEELENVGEKGSPRVRRGDLPKKASKQKPKLEADGPDLAGELLLSRLGVR
jgi:hypothetical protein